MSKKNKSYEYVFFDLDGTITDSAEGIINSAKVALDIIGVEEDDDILYSFIGPPLRYSFAMYSGVDEKLATKAIEAYRKRYDTLGWKESTLYDGIFELIKSLHKQGKKLALASAKPEPFCVRVLEHYGLAQYFEFIGGATFDGTREEKADIIAYSLENVGNPDRDSVIMIGDRSYDILGAKKLGIKSVGVKYGYAIDDELEKAGADFIANNVADLYDILLP